MKQIHRNQLNPQKCCKGFMSDFSYGDYVYLNDMNEIPNRYSEILFSNICADVTIKTPSTTLRKY